MSARANLLFFAFLSGVFAFLIFSLFGLIVALGGGSTRVALLYTGAAAGAGTLSLLMILVLFLMKLRSDARMRRGPPPGV